MLCYFVHFVEPFFSTKVLTDCLHSRRRTQTMSLGEKNIQNTPNFTCPDRVRLDSSRSYKSPLLILQQNFLLMQKFGIGNILQFSAAHVS